MFARFTMLTLTLCAALVAPAAACDVLTGQAVVAQNYGAAAVAGAPVVAVQAAPICAVQAYAAPVAVQSFAVQAYAAPLVVQSLAVPVAVVQQAVVVQKHAAVVVAQGVRRFRPVASAIAAVRANVAARRAGAAVLVVH